MKLWLRGGWVDVGEPPHSQRRGHRASGYPNQCVGSARRPGTPHTFWATFRCPQLDRGHQGLEGSVRLRLSTAAWGPRAGCPVPPTRGGESVGGPPLPVLCPHSLHTTPTWVTESEGAWQAGFWSPLIPWGQCGPGSHLPGTEPARPGCRGDRASVGGCTVAFRPVLPGA